jgi:hypothetical protein
MSNWSRQRSATESEEADLAKKMFFGGCLALPWLWAANSLYFKDKILDGSADPEVKKCKRSCSKLVEGKGRSYFWA